MIILEGKHATWLRGLSPIINAVKVLSADPMNPAPMELQYIPRKNDPGWEELHIHALAEGQLGAANHRVGMG